MKKSHRVIGETTESFIVWPLILCIICILCISIVIITCLVCTEKGKALRTGTVDNTKEE